MIIKRLYIQNYRCFGEEPAVIDFSTTGMMAFVGSNNAGKSTALKALEILLGDKWPMSQFSEDDFYHQDFDRKIVIACQFSEMIAVPKSKGSPDKVNVRGLMIEVSYLDSEQGQSATEVEYRLISEINDFTVADWEVATYGHAGKEIYVSQDIRNHLPIAITIPLIKLHSEQPTNKWGVLGKMLQKVENAFSSNIERKARFETEIENAVQVLREPEEFKSLETDIKQFWDDVRSRNLTGTSLEFLDHDPWHYYRQFRLAITKNGKDVPLDSLGEGVQRLAIIALYRAYLKNHNRSQKAILLIEEPESYLHPQARSVVYQTLRKAIEGTDVEGQIVYTTHSSDFIDCGFFNELCIFSESPEGSKVRTVNDDQLRYQTELLTGHSSAEQIPPNIYYRLTEVDTFGLKDALFGDKALIVEGSSELELFRALGDIESDQISVVVAKGKTNIPAIFSFLSAFGIPSLICIDRDLKSEARNAGFSNSNILTLINQPKVNRRLEGWVDVTEADLDAVVSGSQKSFSNLLVISKDLENFLAAQLPDYKNLDQELAKIVPTSKPKKTFALGLAYRDKLPILALSQAQKDKLTELSNIFKTFLSQPVERPLLALADTGNE